MEEKTEGKKFSIEDTSQCHTLDTQSQTMSDFCSLSSEETQLSGFSTNKNVSLNLHSGISFAMSESQDSLETPDESCSFSGSHSLISCEDSSQHKICSSDETAKKGKESDLDSCEKESDLKPDSLSETNLPSVGEICVPESASPSVKTVCLDTFKSDLRDCITQVGSTDVSKEIVTDNEATKKRSFEKLIKEDCMQSADSWVAEEAPPCKKFKSELQVEKGSNNKGVSNSPSSAGIFSGCQQNPTTDDSQQNVPASDSQQNVPVSDTKQNFTTADSQLNVHSQWNVAIEQQNIPTTDCQQDITASDSQQNLLISDSSQSLTKSVPVETDSRSDAQKENISEMVSSGEIGPFKPQLTEMEEVEDEYQPYNFSQVPKFLASCSEEFQKINFLKGCKWAPDGSCILTNSDDRCLRLFNLPEQIYNSEINDIPPLESVLKMQESGTIYDYCWYPGMSSTMPETCCLLSTSKDTPVHMWDAFTAELRCSYRAYDQMDEVVAANSLAFSLDGQKLYCGFNKMIRVFDVERPGRQFTERPTYIKKSGGQAGIISCITPSPVNHNLYATGSYSKEIALYWEPAGNLMCMFQGHQGGVTHINFSPDGNRIYSGGRKDPEILCWDLRSPGTILFTLLRQSETNQRIYFDLDRSGRYIMSGNHDGTITVWDTTAAPVTVSSDTDPLLYPCLIYPAHNDTTNGISIHPSLPIVASTSGQRHFSVFDDSGSEDDTTQKPTYANNLQLWWFT